jgi:DNA processing protein
MHTFERTLLHISHTYRPNYRVFAACIQMLIDAQVQTDDEAIGFLRSCSRDLVPFLETENTPITTELVEATYTKYVSQGVCAVTYVSPQYPQKLKNIKKPPLVLYYKGDISRASSPVQCAIVGSRNTTRYGERVLQDVIKGLHGTNIVIVSGLAKGVDGLAHEQALAHKLVTIGVVGGGLDTQSLYPREHISLANTIVQNGGLLLSEYPMGFAPTRYSFPERNRIIAGLCDIVWVVEAGVKSGSLITAKEVFALEKPCFTTIVPLYESTYMGNIELLQSGARPLMSEKEIQEVFQEKVYISPSQTISQTVTPAFDNPILSHISFTGVHLDTLAEIMTLSSSEVLSLLTMLEMDGAIRHAGSNIWVRL